MSDETFPKSAHIRRPSEFDHVYAVDTFAADGVLVVNAARNDLAVTRLGLSISRKYGNAVVRNRWKRLIREAFRKTRGNLPVGLDLIVRPKRGAKPEYAAILQSLPQLVPLVVRRLQKRDEQRR